ncbi:MAG: ABC transporter substrate-binding protein [Actinomycetota bacterium]
MNHRAARLSGAVIALALIISACGQKPGVNAGGSFGGQVPPGAVVDPETGAVVDPETGVPFNPGTDPITGIPTTGPNPGDDPTTPGQPEVPAGGGDKTGITDTTITIGIHAPTTGAAPIESVVFEKGADLYWRWLAKKGQKVLGRDVKVVFRNDEYSPTTAVAVCKKMAEDQKAFLLIGGAGTDQINACAGYAEPRKIPYLSPGVQESGLNSRSNYLAVSMTYQAQMAPLVQLLKRVHAKKSLDKYGSLNGGNGKIKVGFIRPNTPNFNDADEALKAAVLAADWEYKAFSVVKEGNSNEAQTVASQLQQQGVDIAVPITAPLFTTNLVINADKNGYKPKWSGIAITNNVNAMIDTACKGSNPGMEGAIFFSPWPGWKNLVEGKDPEFARAAKELAPSVNNRKNGDLLYALWGIMRTIHQMFKAAGPDVSRESFISTGRSFSMKSNLFPTLQYSPGNPFGARDTNVLLGGCDIKGDGVNSQTGAQWITHPDYPGLYSSF